MIKENKKATESTKWTICMIIWSVTLNNKHNHNNNKTFVVIDNKPLEKEWSTVTSSKGPSVKSLRTFVASCCGYSYSSRILPFHGRSFSTLRTAAWVHWRAAFRWYRSQHFFPATWHVQFGNIMRRFKIWN